MYDLRIIKNEKSKLIGTIIHSRELSSLRKCPSCTCEIHLLYRIEEIGLLMKKHWHLVTFDLVHCINSFFIKLGFSVIGSVFYLFLYDEFNLIFSLTDAQHRAKPLHRCHKKKENKQKMKWLFGSMWSNW